MAQQRAVRLPQARSEDSIISSAAVVVSPAKAGSAIGPSATAEAKAAPVTSVVPAAAAAAVVVAAAATTTTTTTPVVVAAAASATSSPTVSLPLPTRTSAHSFARVPKLPSVVEMVADKQPPQPQSQPQPHSQHSQPSSQSSTPSRMNPPSSLPRTGSRLAEVQQVFKTSAAGTAVPGESSALCNTSSSPLPSSAPPADDSSDDVSDRVKADVEQMTKKLHWLLDMIKVHGKPDAAGGFSTITYGALFSATEQHTATLSGMLNIARKHRLVAFEGETLFQGSSDHVLITVLTDNLSSISAASSYKRGSSGVLIDRSRRRSSVGIAAGTNPNCAHCAKVVYPTELLLLNGRPYHGKTCARCHTCNKVLNNNNFAENDSVLYCTTHFERLFLAAGGCYKFSVST